MGNTTIMRNASDVKFVNNTLFIIIKRITAFLVVIFSMFAIISCTNDSPSPVAKILGNTYRTKKVYTVKKGDDIYSVATKLGVQYQHLVDMNSLWKPYKITPGEKLSYMQKQNNNSNLQQNSNNFRQNNNYSDGQQSGDDSNSNYQNGNDQQNINSNLAANSAAPNADEEDLETPVYTETQKVYTKNNNAAQKSSNMSQNGIASQNSNLVQSSNAVQHINNPAKNGKALQNGKNTSSNSNVAKNNQNQSLKNTGKVITNTNTNIKTNANTNINTNTNTVNNPNNSNSKNRAYTTNTDNTESQHANNIVKPAPATPATALGKDKWAWPLNGGKIVSNFDTPNTTLKGINIVAALGTPIFAAGSGEVVYSGNALRGYGNLIIIKHNENFLSAYAHNKEIIVKEGDKVKIGQQIATMGDTGAKSVMLHFEIRRNGKPIDPLLMLPKR